MRPSIVRGAKKLLGPGEAIVALVDDRDARDAMRGVRGNINMMGTQSFIQWMEQDFGIAPAADAWTAILVATTGRLGLHRAIIRAKRRPIGLHATVCGKRMVPFGTNNPRGATTHALCA